MEANEETGITPNKPKSINPEITIEAPLSAVSTEAPTDEQRLLAEVRESLQQPPPPDVPRTSLPITTPVLNEKPVGFRQPLLKVLRNYFFYPDTLQFSITAAGAITELIATLVLLETSLLQAVLIGGGGIIAGLEVLSRHKRTNDLSRFLRIRKIRLEKEKVLSDGTKVTLDDDVGALHLSGLRRLVSVRNKRERSLIIGGSVLEGLINLAEKIEGNDPFFTNFSAFKATSSFIPPHQAARLGFEVVQPAGLPSRLHSAIRFIDNFLTRSPSATRGVGEVWISRQGLINNKDRFQQELARFQPALERRA